MDRSKRGMPAVSVLPPLVSTALSLVFPSECELFNQSVAESEIGEGNEGIFILHTRRLSYPL